MHYRLLEFAEPHKKSTGKKNDGAMEQPAKKSPNW
jgi:hypothetical protein